MDILRYRHSGSTMFLFRLRINIYGSLYDERVKEGIEKRIKGTVAILKKLEIPPQTILLKIQEQYHLSPEVSKKYL